MSESVHRQFKACMQNCEQSYRKCMVQGESDTYCQIQHTPCRSRCNDAYLAGLSASESV